MKRITGNMIKYKQFYDWVLILFDALNGRVAILNESLTRL
jgi:hypothetical protein